MDLLLDAFHYAFIQRALIAGCFIAVLCSTLGIFMVLRRLSLIGDGLAHVTFGSVAVGIVAGVYPLYASLPLVVLGSLGILKLTETARIYGDTAIGMVSSFGIALGILLVSISGGLNVDLFSYLFGNILVISNTELWLSVGLSVAVLATVVFFYQDLFLITFDDEFAKVSGVRVDRLNKLLIILTAVTVVLAMKVVGIMLVSSLLILPASAALQVARSFRAALIIAGVLSLLSLVLGLFFSFFGDLPGGATVVLMNFIFFGLAFMYRALRS